MFLENGGAKACDDRSESENQMIYFIKSAGYVKIGFCARDPMRRLEKLQIGNPMTLRLVALAEGDMADERDLHSRFRKQRVRGEWFRLDEAVNAYIANYAVDHDEASRNRPERQICGKPAHLVYAGIERLIAEAQREGRNPLDRLHMPNLS